MLLSTLAKHSCKRLLYYVKMLLFGVYKIVFVKPFIFLDSRSFYILERVLHSHKCEAWKALVAKVYRH